MDGQAAGTLAIRHQCHHYDSIEITQPLDAMAAVTIRNLPDEVHRALKIRAAQHNRSTEAEMRAILEAAVRPEGRVRLGTVLSQASRSMGLTNADVETLEEARHQAREWGPAEPMRFE
jgi:plasmid stability protein